MGKLFNEDGSINKDELDSLLEDVVESNRLRDMELDRRNVRIEEIDEEIKEIDMKLSYLASMEYPVLFRGVGLTKVLGEENRLDKIRLKLVKEREELTNKYTL